MNRTLNTLALLTLTSLAATAAAQTDSEAADETLAPFFFVQADDPSVDQLPLKAVSVQAQIVGVIADIVVRQTYVNLGEQALEAIYLFPASTRAAVYGMEMRLGNRRIRAQI